MINIETEKKICPLCGHVLYQKADGLEVHHIIPVSKESTLYFDEDNCICLCKECHKKLHSKY